MERFARAPRGPWTERLLSASLQARFVGAAVRVGGGAGGFSAGLQARVYPPLPVPVPATGTTTGGAGAGARCVAAPPVADALDAAVGATVRRFVADAVGSYGSLYEILTGRQITAAGDAEVDFRWDGCRWIRTGLRY